jgi:hypothetical protein
MESLNIRNSPRKLGLELSQMKQAYCRTTRRIYFSRTYYCPPATVVNQTVVTPPPPPPPPPEPVPEPPVESKTTYTTR